MNDVEKGDPAYEDMECSSDYSSLNFFTLAAAATPLPLSFWTGTFTSLYSALFFPHRYAIELTLNDFLLPLPAIFTGRAPPFRDGHSFTESYFSLNGRTSGEFVRLNIWDIRLFRFVGETYSVKKRRFVRSLKHSSDVGRVSSLASKIGNFNELLFWMSLRLFGFTLLLI